MNVNEVILETSIRNVVTKKIFPLKQFVIFEKELAPDSALAKKVMEELDVEGLEWNDIKEDVRKNLTNRRNNVQQAVNTLRQGLQQMN